MDDKKVGDIVLKIILAATAAIIWGAFSIHIGLGVIVLALAVLGFLFLILS